MRDLTQHIEKNLSAFQQKEIFVACSGGLDSTVLLHVLSANEFKVSAIHVNYHLREEDSNLDEAFIRDFCKNRNISLEIRSVDLAEQLKLGGNLQQLAREVRYDWFEEITTEKENRFVFLAHHLDDQVETFFLNIARKSGIMGLACMPFERNKIVRPLLDFSKEELKQYAIDNQLSWREDVSNTSNKYRRNLLRNEVLPYLTTQLPELNASVINLVKVFQANQLRLENKIRPLVTRISEINSIEQAKIEQLNEFELVELFRQLRQPAQFAKEFEQLFQSQKGKRLELIPHVDNPFSAIVKEEVSFSFIPISEQLIDLKFKMEIIESLPKVFTKNEIYLDRDKIKGELKLRTWEIGDRIYSIGMKGSQLISDVIGDAKINAIDKQNVLVIHDDETIHWCVGLKVGRKSVASILSDKIIKITVSSTK
jgi:tRNA(Ile)-lysidine synthase